MVCLCVMVWSVSVSIPVNGVVIYKYVYTLVCLLFIKVCFLLITKADEES